MSRNVARAHPVFYKSPPKMGSDSISICRAISSCIAAVSDLRHELSKVRALEFSALIRRRHQFLAAHAAYNSGSGKPGGSVTLASIASSTIRRTANLLDTVKTRITALSINLRECRIRVINVVRLDAADELLIVACTTPSADEPPGCSAGANGEPTDKGKPYGGSGNIAGNPA